MVSILITVAIAWMASAMHDAQIEKDRVGRYCYIYTMVDGTQYKVRQRLSDGDPIATLILADGTWKDVAVAQIKDMSYVGEQHSK